MIELLVVIAIIAILIGLLLPAVQKVRESAARTKCQNNLKNIALGAHLYQDTYKKLPTGWLTDGSSAGIPNPGWSWATLILPYIEQKNVYDSVGNNLSAPLPTVGVFVAPPNGPNGPGPAATGAYLQTKINLYRCPSDATPDANPYLNNYGTNNYVCNKEVLGPGRTNGSNVQDGLSIETIRDGASNTILFGERDGDRNIAATWVRANATTASFEGRPGYGINPDPKKAGKTQWTTGDNERLAYGSPHTGGAQFAMGDGRVIFIRETIDADPNDTHVAFPACNGAALCSGLGLLSPYTLQKLQHPADRQPVVID